MAKDIFDKIKIKEGDLTEMKLASERGLKTIAFPAVGTGIAGFPLKRCAEVMIEETVSYLAEGGALDQVYFVLFGQDPHEAFTKALESARKG